MGPDRTLPKLAEEYRSRTEPVPTKQLSRLKEWSAKYKWTERIEQFEDEQAEEELRIAARIDANTSLKTSIELNKRAEYIDAMKMDELIRMRETVRKPMPKGGANVNVSVSVEMRHLAEQLASELGMGAEDLIAEAEAIAEEAYRKAGKA